jgi:hypothetical protein
MCSHTPIVTVVIPCFWQDYHYLLSWFKAYISLSNNRVDYLVVLNGLAQSEYIDLYECKNLTYIRVSAACTPGEARNLALSNIRHGHVAFLDIRTIPSRDWISYVIKYCYNNPLGSQIGSVRYVPTKLWHYPLLSSTYGFKAINSLPGSIFHISAVLTNGLFLNGFRAGEDLDWLWRINNRGILEPGNTPVLEYSIDYNLGLLYYLRKWFRNYSHSSLLPYVSRHQRVYYAFFLLFSLVILSYFWNNIFADWNVNSPLYIPYVTRLTFGYAMTIYISLRCIYLPTIKGLPLSHALLQAPIVLVFSFLFDIAKLLAFISSAIHTSIRYDKY